MQGMTSADQIGMLTIITTIAIIAFVFLVLFVATAPVRQTANISPWAPRELGQAAAYREPADPSYVDELIRVRGIAPVIHNPAPLDELMSDSSRYVIQLERGADQRESRYAMPIAELVASARYVLPSVPVSPAGPARHVESVGRHRAPVLVAA